MPEACQKDCQRERGGEGEGAWTRLGEEGGETEGERARVCAAGVGPESARGRGRREGEAGGRRERWAGGEEGTKRERRQGDGIIAWLEGYSATWLLHPACAAGGCRHTAMGRASPLSSCLPSRSEPLLLPILGSRTWRLSTCCSNPSLEATKIAPEQPSMLSSVHPARLYADVVLIPRWLAACRQRGSLQLLALPFVPGLPIAIGTHGDPATHFEPYVRAASWDPFPFGSGWAVPTYADVARILSSSSQSRGLAVLAHPLVVSDPVPQQCMRDDTLIYLPTGECITARPKHATSSRLLEERR